MPRVFQPFSVLDTHKDSFYESVPVTLYQGALGGLRVSPRFARFWFHSLTPYRAWVITWVCKGDSPTIYLVDVSRIGISYQGTEPPPMPKWAYDGRGLKWIQERNGKT